LGKDVYMDALSEDALDKEQLEQLHAATLKAADSCFELKKLCATVLIPTGTLVSILSQNRLNPAVFVAGLLVITAFWLADSVAYYYQRKLRSAMTPIWQRRAQRLDTGYAHVPQTEAVRPLKAAFNSSMWFYGILAVIVVSLLVAFGVGLIPGTR
jgi:hypothetical protein